ncbi:MAG: OB-fold domain-containing protein [Deltaproteobacteria bacterium]|nr:OB-fold domain-containing protein [Deltaproteobacteria bacterium]
MTTRSSDPAFAKPLPLATQTSAPFWEGLRRGEVCLQRCEACEAWVFHPRSNCPRCLSTKLAWRKVAGTGRLHTFTITRVPTAPFFADEVPQMLAVVELDEGVRIPSTLVGVAEDEIVIGMRVAPVFEPTVGGESVLLRFTKAWAPGPR